jgi:phosphohistidine phosphatase
VQHQTRRIVLVRHAKARPDGPTDAERQLEDRGRADAAAAGRWLAGQQVTPDHALVSAATRTRQTWEAMAAAAGWTLEPELDRGLYSAGPETALDLMRLTPAEATTLVVVGHNPTVAYLAHLLDDGEGDVGAATEMAGGYPTGALTLYEYDGEWADLAPGSATVLAFHVPRG